MVHILQIPAPGPFVDYRIDSETAVMTPQEISIISLPRPPDDAAKQPLVGLQLFGGGAEVAILIVGRLHTAQIPQMLGYNKHDPVATRILLGGLNRTIRPRRPQRQV